MPISENACPGADDPEERCPKHPSECTCWEVDNDHPARKLALSQASPSDAERHERPIPDDIKQAAYDCARGIYLNVDDGGVPYLTEDDICEIAKYILAERTRSAAPLPPAAAQELVAVKAVSHTPVSNVSELGEPISTEQLLACVASIICEETCGLTSLCKSREAAKSLFARGYLTRSIASENNSLSLGITKEWFEEQAALEGDLEIGAGGRRLTKTINLSDDELAELERLINPAATEIAALRAENERLRKAMPEELTGKLQWAMHDAFLKSKADTLAGQMIDVYDAVRAAVAPEQEEAK
ncbi:hypothetical protein G6M04_14655 [Agrobacterium rhizogenes]|uniref:hypothetical protein n=1 Tax=Rhizobium rhizogenes TaxID=359 RepID=UPI001571FD5B|nr:hypothetical protein [Rhizobium rhizogenes]NTG48631.1 hypothetical protein [Rhizobium rhizogenes]